MNNVHEKNEDMYMRLQNLAANNIEAGTDILVAGGTDTDELSKTMICLTATMICTTGAVDAPGSAA